MNPYTNFSIPAFDQFLVWLATTDLRLFLYRFEALDRAAVFVHIAAAGILLGSILLVDLRLMGFAKKLDLKDLATAAIPWALWSGIVAMASGILLLLFDPIAVGIHTFFLPKMALIVLGAINALAFHRLVRVDGAEHRVSGAKAAGAISLALWLGVFLCASLNATERISASSHARAE